MLYFWEFAWLRGTEIVFTTVAPTVIPLGNSRGVVTKLFKAAEIYLFFVQSGAALHNTSW